MTSSRDQVDTLDEILLLTQIGDKAIDADAAKIILNLPSVRQAKAKLSAREVAARLDTVQTALRACPTKDDMLRKWLIEHEKVLQQGASASTESLTASGKQADNHNEESAR